MTNQLPPDVIAQLTAMGPTITPELVQGSWALLTPFHEKTGYTAPKIDRDQRYGDHERHRLDVHTSGQPAEKPTPVVLFVHGGGFTGGDKHVPGTPMYDHIGAWAVRNGWVGVTMTYRLAPEHPGRPARKTSQPPCSGSARTSPPTAAIRTGSWWRATRPAACTSPLTSSATAAARSTACAGPACARLLHDRRR